MDYDGWAQMGNRGWGYAGLLPYFKRTERRVGEGDDAYRGREGALTVEDLAWKHPLCEAFIDGAVSIRIPRNPEYNGPTQEGIGYFQRAVPGGRSIRCARAFPAPGTPRPHPAVAPKDP